MPTPVQRRQVVMTVLTVLSALLISPLGLSHAPTLRADGSSSALVRAELAAPGIAAAERAGRPHAEPRALPWAEAPQVVSDRDRGPSSWIAPTSGGHLPATAPAEPDSRGPPAH